ncbi:MAG: GAF domain-containing protein, partial [Syntrophaceae bacterium]|nr:GAF domain-containing protein [Syntrophaceae bacterium]
MDDTPLYSSKLTKNYAEYLKQHYPDVDLNPLLEYAGIALHQLEDEGHWLSQKQVDRFNEIVVQNTENPNISRDVGRHTPLSAVGSTFLTQYMLGFLSPSLAYAKLEKAYTYVVRGCKIHVRRIGTNKVDIVATTNPGVMEKPYQCENRIGFLEAIAKLFTGKFAGIQHPECLHKGGDRCHYIVSWEQNRSALWKRIRNALMLFSVIVIPVFLLLMPPDYSIFPVLLYIFTVAGVSLYQVSLEKKELEAKFLSMGDTSNRLMNQINITYNNAMLIQKIGQASARGPKIDILLENIMKAIEECLDFDRGVILLANEERTRLVYREAFGYELELAKENLARSISFHLDKAESRGHFVLAFKQQKAFLVNDLKEIEDSFSKKSLEIAKAMGIKSFVCVPIIYEGRSEGILAVDNMHSKRILTQSDLNLLLGIAPQIGISINNARTYQKVIESEERFRALGENSPDIIYTLDATGALTYI